MDNFIKLGRFFFAIAMVAFGIQHFIYAHFAAGVGPPWFPGAPLGAYLTGAVLTGTGVAMVLGTKTRWAAALLGAMLLMFFLLLHVPKVAASLHDAGRRTSAFEILAVCGGALVVAGTRSGERSGLKGNGASNKVATVGCFLLALSMVIFGVDHLLYARFVATLVPSWIPGHLFWTYLTAAGFIAAGVSNVVGKFGRLGATSLGLMFFLWFVLLHSPRVAASPRNANEWTSAFVALAMCGSSLVVAGSLPRENQRTDN